MASFWGDLICDRQRRSLPVDRDSAQMTVEAAEAGLIAIEQATQSLALLALRSYSELNFDDQLL
jgi:hypothetical protein